MEISFRELKRHYASLSDDELLAIDRDELTRAAQGAYDTEVADRGLHEPSPAAGPIADYDVKPDWSNGGICICSFVDVPGGGAAEKIAKSRAALEVFGIPNEMKTTEDEESGKELVGVMVPTMYGPHAAAILDRDVVNEEYESEWRAQLAILSNEALKVLDPRVFCAGLLDRVARMKRAYSEEMRSRNLSPRPE